MGPQVKDVMTQKPRKMVENYSRAFGKTMGVKAPNNGNNDNTTMSITVNKTVRCTYCGKVYQNFNQVDGFDKVRCSGCEKVFQL